MFNKLFRSTSKDAKEVSCEITGKSATLDDTVSLVKINGVIITKNFQNPEIDFESKTIYSATKPPIKFYREILVPNELKPVFGRLFAMVDDEDEVEKSTGIASEEGINRFTGESLLPLIQYVQQAEVLQIPESMFFAIISKEESLVKKNCENWNLEFKGIGRKYMSKNILDTRKVKQQYGVPGILLPGWDVGISDVAQKHPQGNGYFFKTDKTFKPIDLCSNESAVDYCKKNNVLIYYNDFLNKGKLRLLSEYTPEINRHLQNANLYRSSNI
ncbi:MAG: hypothetical protein GC192_24095 [Bacteroidetes bacterium]|nr:hypothetical protein [Bacteroidota bacterium]